MKAKIYFQFIAKKKNGKQKSRTKLSKLKGGPKAGRNFFSLLKGRRKEEAKEPEV